VPDTVLVIGGGVIGLGCALRIAREGSRVTLVDRDEPGRGTSFGNAGHIATEQVFPLASPEVVRGSLRYLLDRESPLRIRPGYLLGILPWLARFAWASRHDSFVRGTEAIKSLQRTAAADLVELMRLAGAPGLVHLDGNVMLVERAESVAMAKAEIARVAEHGVRAEWLSASDVKAIAPELAAPIEGAWRFSGTGHVEDPYAVSRALADALRAAGGEIVRGEIKVVESDGAEFVARTADGRALRASRVVLSCGAFSKPLAAQLGYRVPLDTERGYHITLPAARASFRVPISSFDRKVIMTPMSCGLRMTGTVEFGGLKLPPDPHRLAMLERHMKALVPSMPMEGMTTWMGFRPSLPDHLPVMGRVPDGRNVFFAFGHQHLGLTLSGVNARVIADVVAGRDPGIDMRPFSPARFT